MLKNGMANRYKHIGAGFKSCGNGMKRCKRDNRKKFEKFNLSIEVTKMKSQNIITGTIKQGDLEVNFVGEDYRFIFIPSQYSPQPILSIIKLVY